MAIYNLSGKADIWWQDLKRVKGINEKNVNWSTYKRYFKKKFLSEQYYEERAKEFYELKLGSMTMKDLNNKFLSLLRYVPYLVDEKPRYSDSLDVYLIILKIELNMITQRPWRKL